MRLVDGSLDTNGFEFRHGVWSFAESEKVFFRRVEAQVEVDRKLNQSEESHSRMLLESEISLPVDLHRSDPSSLYSAIYPGDPQRLSRHA